MTEAVFNLVVGVNTNNGVDENGKEDWHRYCDVWRFRDGKMAELKAFVMKP